MTVTKTAIEGLLVLEPNVFGDHRGWFTETYSKRALEKAGIIADFVQDNQSMSVQKGTLRGLHFQNHPMAQAKLIRCIQGAILDVAVDLRSGSASYCQWVSVELNEQNKKQFFLPKGFAHGFITLTDQVQVEYKVDAYYSPEHDRSIRFDDPQIGVDWGTELPVLSAKDANAPMLKDSDIHF